MKKRKHICDLDLGSDSMLPKKTTVPGRACRYLRKLGQLTKLHPETFEHFRSYSAVVAERQRQLLEDGGHVIHPFSIISLAWMTFMIIVNLAHMSLSTLRLFFVLQPVNQTTVHPVDRPILCLNVICLIDMLIKINTGYVHKKQSLIVMSRKSIFCRYLRRWFIIDLASSLPVAYVVLHMNLDRRLVLVAHFMAVLRVTKIYTVTANVKIFMRIFTESYIVHGLVRLTLLFALTTHWCSCLLYSPAVVHYYWTGTMHGTPTYHMNIYRTESQVQDMQTRYNKALIVALSSFFGTGFTMFRSTAPDEILVHSLIIVYAAMFMVFTLVFLIKSYLTIFGSIMRYQGLMNQVEEYMKYRQFPLSLKKRVRAFYQYRYQERYFKEEADLDCLSEELRDEIKLHTCRTLVHKVKLFEDVPASVVGTVLGCLRPEVYLSNDLVVRAGDIGDCMYFIATGTVAVYSLKGVEVCHLEDGTHFGEVALLMKDSKRVATVVAVEITQLYRLDAHDFNRFVMSNTTLYNRIEALASLRMHETTLLDDAFRRERESQQEQHQSDMMHEVPAPMTEP
ncbi:potassium/sodium hyperpolarization-activated cyclic nucleotide-gated channel 3-like isoform X1 [Helicoverpa zea]|uniref:potassium/sodium hyperpolarization-activated cyclic nucleotide-gated channel 3-like isoform X1 n=2 Tax=Helicoverpa zea TaxID=7113 RepID=UPI001F58D9BE|nr:potassium/sodium hyperpolarization-activated cyclic nucleotide-gated channel 3-like isoform X1 [Helicoverpa zea]